VGRVYVYVKPGAGWTNMTQTAMLTASDGALDDDFGKSIGISGDVVVAGSEAHNIGPGGDQGLAYVFVKPGFNWTNMTETAKLTASDAGAADRLGGSVAISGDTIVAGASMQDDGVPGSNYGAAYLYTKPPGGWTNMTQTAKLTASDSVSDDQVGSHVAISGATLMVGAYKADAGPLFADAGKVYEYEQPSTGWATGTQSQILQLDTSGDLSQGDQLGYSAAISGDFAVVGAIFDDTSFTNDGSAYIFQRTGSTWSRVAKLTASNPIPSRPLRLCRRNRRWRRGNRDGRINPNYSLCLCETTEWLARHDRDGQTYSGRFHRLRAG
jgi:hypothetical protein